MTKMARQLNIFDQIRCVPSRDEIAWGIIVGPDELMSSFGINLRMLQRDLKDFRDSGLINVRYDRIKDRYIRVETKPAKGDLPERRRQHLYRLFRLGTLIDSLSRTPLSTIEDHESGVRMFNDFLEWVKETDDKITREEIEWEREQIPEPPPVYDLRAEYYHLFPDSNERTRQRDFKELREAGFSLYYSTRYRSYIFEDDDRN